MILLCCEGSETSTGRILCYKNELVVCFWQLNSQLVSIHDFMCVANVSLMHLTLLLGKHYDKITLLWRRTDRYGLCCSLSIVSDLNCRKGWHLRASDLQLCMWLSEPALISMQQNSHISQSASVCRTLLGTSWLYLMVRRN